MAGYNTFVFDFDSTLVNVESLDRLAAIALQNTPDKEAVLTELQAITDQGMEGKMGFDESLRRRLALFSATNSHLDQLVQELCGSISKSAQDHHAWFAQNKDRVYVVSGGFADYIQPVVSLLGIRPDHVFANHFTFDGNGNITGFKPDGHLSRAGGKVAQLAELQLARPLVMIGDGYTDYEVMAYGQADQFWAMVETIDRPAVTTKADRVLASFAEIQRVTPETGGGLSATGADRAS